jgi:hypothetical protein
MKRDPLRMHRFQELWDGLPDSELVTWRRVELGRYHFVTAFDWVGMVGESEAPSEKYHIELNEVSILTVDPASIDGAIRSCDLDLSEYTGIQKHDALAEALHDYGTKGCLSQWNGSNLATLLRTARKLSREYEKDEDAYQNALAQPANKMGNTVEQFRDGNSFGRAAQIMKTAKGVVASYALMLERQVRQTERQLRTVTEERDQLRAQLAKREEPGNSG